MTALNAASGMNYGQQNANKPLMIACDAIFAFWPIDVSTGDGVIRHKGLLNLPDAVIAQRCLARRCLRQGRVKMLLRLGQERDGCIRFPCRDAGIGQHMSGGADDARKQERKSALLIIKSPAASNSRCREFEAYRYLISRLIWSRP